jgi:hypothetical protein
MPIVKTATVDPRLCEERATSGPKISYTAALALYLVTRSGAICQGLYSEGYAASDYTSFGHTGELWSM